MTWRDKFIEQRIYEDGTTTERELDTGEINVLTSYREMKRIYPNCNYIIFNPESYGGYNMETGKKIKVVVQEVKDD